MSLYLLDYGAGNVASLANSLKKLGHNFTWISSPEDFAKAEKLIFPGVGAFRHAIENLKQKGLLEPLRDYLASGRPYFGICIGMQVLFAESMEHASVDGPTQGLGVIPYTIDRFSSEDNHGGKSVPHMGWNIAERLRPKEADDLIDIGDDLSYYFVHSYRATYDPNSPLNDWTYTTTQYGQEVFVSSSGPVGLRLLDSWVKAPITGSVASFAPKEPILRPPKARDGLAKRVIACMDVRSNDEGDLVVTKGDQYDVREKVTNGLTAQTGGAVRNLGKPVTLAAKYFAAGADEICFLNITSFRSSPLRDQPMLAVLQAAANEVFVPMTIGGGIKDSVDPDGTPHSALEVAGTYFRAGADKVSIGSEAVFNVEALLKDGRPTGKTGIETIAHAYGSQAVVVSIDPRRVYVDPATYDGPYMNELVRGVEGDEKGKAWWYQCTVSGGRENRPLSVVQLAKGVEQLGAGELLINSIDRDGTGKGFDIDLINLIKDAVKIPVVASSGAGKENHFTEVFQKTKAEAALAAGIFHREEVGIQAVKDEMSRNTIMIRRL
ncbi:putative HIS7-glutamine amidotransferase/cyclase [Serendipita vermifera]|nr:putative HIS7-glutamine amidotransferase/cyclase [Serendipita vermifera]